MSGRNVAMQTFCLCAASRRASPIERCRHNDALRQSRGPGLVSPGLVRLPVPSKRQPQRTAEENRSVVVGAAAAAAAPVAAAAAAPGCELLIGFATAYALPFFGLMLFAPQWEKTQQLLGSMALFIPLAVVYIYLLTMSWQPDTLQLMMPGNVQEGMTGFKPQFFPKLESISALFGRLTTAASVWIHILIINLFVARLCYFKGLASKIPTFHTILIATFFGPLAILSQAITQSVCGKSESKSSPESEPEPTSSSSSGTAGEKTDTSSKMPISIPDVGVELPNGSAPKKQAFDFPTPEVASTSAKKSDTSSTEPIVSPEAAEEQEVTSKPPPPPPPPSKPLPKLKILADQVGGTKPKVESAGGTGKATNGTLPKGKVDSTEKKPEESSTTTETKIPVKGKNDKAKNEKLGKKVAAATSADQTIEQEAIEMPREEKFKKGSKHLFGNLFGSQGEDEGVEVVQQQGGNVVLKHDGGNIILEPYVDKRGSGRER
ncbi:hypothetical protein BSKO_05391 [Bryopsis sp. KO-2023]|nr:hypothetical protein BSKO_05391 [Bryopsis sp. KO-2023]